MRFEFATATRIIFGPGTIKEVAPLVTKLGQRAFVTAGRSTERVMPLIELLGKQGIKSTIFNVAGEPTTTMAIAGVQKAREAECDFVIGIGGGSALDTGKVIAALLTNRGELFDYLEVIGGGQPLLQNPVPYIAIPTTAGSGAEVTRNSVLASLEHRVKVSMRSPLMLPYLTVVDPVLTYSMPPSLTASTGLDALTQLIEAYISHQANPLTDGICKEGMQRIAYSLGKAYKNGNDTAARENMAMASLFGGLALANSKLGAVHGIAGPLGGMISIPHGIICAQLLPHVIETNVCALKSRAPNSPALKRYDEVARILTGKATAKAVDGILWIQELCTVFDISPLTNFGLTEKDFPVVVTKAKKAGSMKGNPITLTDEELTKILKKAI